MRQIFKIGTALIYILTLNLNAQSLDFKQIEKVNLEILKLIESPEPIFKPLENMPEMDSKTISDLGFEQVYKNESKRFEMKDGVMLNAFYYKSNSNTTVILLHGILSSGYVMNKTAGLIREATNAEVYALDLRGHGVSEGRPGDVDYIGQYTSDILDIIKNIKQLKPKGNIILAGHSMGGGISLNVNMVDDKLIDGYRLLAPHLGENAPLNTSAQKSDYEFMKIHLNRTLGLKLMNAMGEKKHNKLPVLFFNLPSGSPITTYSYRANESISPKDYKISLKKISKPMFLLIGGKDEVFNAVAYKNAVKKYCSSAKAYIVKNETHNGIRHNPETMKEIKQWFAINKW